MPFSGGTFSRVHDWTTDKGNSVAVTASRMDSEHDGFATGLSTGICKDGQTTTTAAIPFAIGIMLGDGTAGTPSLRFTSDTDTGIWRAGDNLMALGASATQTMLVGTATVSMTSLTLTVPLATTQGGVGAASANSCRVFHDADQAIADATNTDLSFNTEIFDNNALHSTAATTNRINIVTDGTYVIVGNARFEVATALPQNSIFTASIKLDGTSYLAQAGRTLPSGASSTTTTVNVVGMASLTAGQYVTLEVHQDSGSERAIKTVAGISPIFSAARIYA